MDGSTVGAVAIGFITAIAGFPIYDGKTFYPNNLIMLIALVVLWNIFYHRMTE